MALTSIDWIVIVGYLLINLAIGIYYRRRAGGNTEEFFISGRDVSWWLAGTSMVATTFAADTPLFVSGVIAAQGIAGNWIWWTSCLGGMMTVFFFARYWRRAEVLTEISLGMRGNPLPSECSERPHALVLSDSGAGVNARRSFVCLGQGNPEAPALNLSADSQGLRKATLSRAASPTLARIVLQRPTQIGFGSPR